MSQLRRQIPRQNQHKQTSIPKPGMGHRAPKMKITTWICLRIGHPQNPMVSQHFPIIVKIASPGIFPPFQTLKFQDSSNPQRVPRRALLDRPRRLEGGRRLASIGTAVGGLLDTKGVPKDLPQPQPVLSEDDTLIGHQPATIQGVMGHDPQMRQLQGGKT